jgi:hypothetical protein
MNFPQVHKISVIQYIQSFREIFLLGQRAQLILIDTDMFSYLHKFIIEPGSSLAEPTFLVTVSLYGVFAI